MQMVRLIDDLLDVSRITEGMAELRREPVELVSVIDVAVEISRPIIDAAGQALAIELPIRADYPKRRPRAVGAGVFESAQ
jgi:signal transduction histidine kinase